MAKIQFTPDELKEYVNARRQHAFYKKTVDEAKKMAVHADGEFPTELIETRRPNEPEMVQTYRKAIWIPKTKPAFTKVYSSLQKIRRSSDWNIKHKPEADYPKISEDEDLNTYCEKKFPFFTSVTNWIFQVVLRQYLIDANGGALVVPLNSPLENEYRKPFPIIFRACDVIDYVADDYVVLKNPAGCMYYAGKDLVPGNTLYLVTVSQVLQYNQTTGSGNYKLAGQIDHNMGQLPFVFWKGSMIEYSSTCALYESRIAGMIPELDEAVREYSDLQAGKVLHMYPERWEFSQNECRACKGTGRRPNPGWREGMPLDQCDTQCSSCDNGYIVAGPYAKILVRPPQGLEATNQTQIPTPPAGYITKDVDILNLQERSVEAHIYSALSAINFEFLMDSPLAQSGVAKAQDRDEAGNTANSIVEDIVAFMDSVYEIIALYRYSDQYSANEIREMLPAIAVPEKFDLVTSTDIAESLKMAKESKANPQIINAIEVEFAQKRFAMEPEIRDLLQLTLELDPLAGVSEDDKMSKLSNKGITQLTYIISSNIQEFVQRAMEEDGFPDRDLKEQKVIIAAMAQAILDEQDKARKSVMNGIQQDNIEDSESDSSVPADNPGQPAANAGGDTFPAPQATA